MKQKIVKVISVILTITITVMLIHSVSKIVERKESSFKNHDFFDEKGNFDILFLGTSHVINGVYPLEMWNDYGIVSYNLGGHATPIPTTYWIMKNAFDYTNPKLVVVDCYGLGSNEKISSNFDYAHVSLDSYPLSMTKIRTVNDLLSNDEKNSKLDLLWDFSIYHNRWNQLTSQDFDIRNNIEKGAETRQDIAVPIEVETIAKDCKQEEDTVAVEYLERIIKECKKKNINVLLTYLPFRAERIAQMEANRVYDIAEENEVNYINFLDMDIVNYETDLYDEASHLNPSGAKKITSYLGEYIKDNYSIPDQRENMQYESWWKRYQIYADNKEDYIRGEISPYLYLVLLADNGYELAFEINNTEIFRDEMIYKLVENLGVNMSCISENRTFVTVGHESSKSKVDYVKESECKNQPVNTGIGELKVTYANDEEYSVAIDGRDYYSAFLPDMADIDMKVLIIDANTKEVVEIALYNYICDGNGNAHTELFR